MVSNVTKKTLCVKTYILEFSFIACASICLVNSGSANAQGFDKGFAAYMVGAYSTAFKFWHERAANGSVTAQSNLGFMYENGYGTPKDFVSAHKWYNIAASNGDVTARDSRLRLTDEMSKLQLSEALRQAKSCMLSNLKNCK